jgi:hypothetical protein
MNGEEAEKRAWLLWLAAGAAVVVFIGALWAWIGWRGAAPEPPPLPEGMAAAGKEGVREGGGDGR